MNCKHCHKPVVLVPSAAERAKKYGGTADFYTSLFEYHNECTLELRRVGTSKLIKESQRG